MSRVYEFGRFRLDAEVWSLTVDGQPSPLGPRAVRLLHALVSRSNEFVAKAALLDAAWPGLIVEEANLSVQMSAIRRVFVAQGEDSMRIETLARRGYRFVGAVVVNAPTSAATLMAPVETSQIALERDAFIGRTAELGALAERLATGARLLTLTGAGGSGKTRLARRYARMSLGDWPGGAHFCDLSEATSPDGVIHAVARALAVPLSKADPAMQVAHAIAARGRCLMILDNFEQVVEAAPLVSAWIDLAASAAFIVTSRERLQLHGEEVFAVDPLPIEGDALDLFLVRAHAQQSNWTPSVADRHAVAELVRLLDGMPLAIELAAARCRVLSVPQIVERLRDRFRLLRSPVQTVARQATLEAAIDWSWRLLAPWEQEALGQACAFEGGFTIAAAEAVMEVSEWPDAPPVLDIVQALLDKSLLRQMSLSISGEEEVGELRFGMYISIREFAQAWHTGRNAKAVEEVIRRHGRYFASFGADAAVEALYRHGGVERRRALARDIDNLTAACRRAVVQGEAATATGALCAAWEILAQTGPFSLAVELGVQVCALHSMPDALRVGAFSARAGALGNAGRAEEGLSLLEPLIGWADAHSSVHERAKVRVVAGRLCRELGRNDRAHKLLEQAAVLDSKDERRPLERQIALTLGAVESEQNQIALARDHYERALASAELTGDRQAESASLANLAMLLESEGLPDAARDMYEAALGITRELRNHRTESIVLANLCFIEQSQGNLEKAGQRGDEALKITRHTGDRRFESVVLGHTAELAVLRQMVEHARALFEASLAIDRDIGHPRHQAYVMQRLGTLNLEQGRLDEANLQLEEALTLIRSVGNRRSEGAVLSAIGELRCRQGKIVEARSVVSEGEALLREGNLRAELALLLCVRGQVDVVVGDRVAARAALREASDLAREMNVRDESVLAQNVARLALTLDVERS